MSRGDKPKLSIFNPDDEGGEGDAQSGRPYEPEDYVRYSGTVWKVRVCQETTKGWELTLVHPFMQNVVEHVKPEEVERYLGIVR